MSAPLTVKSIIQGKIGTPGYLEQLFQVVRSVVPEYAAVPSLGMSAHQFTEGLSNHLFRVQAADRPAVLVRVYSGQCGQMVDRDRENMLIQRIHEAQLGPPLYGIFGNGVVYGYIPGRKAHLSEISEPHVWPAIARGLAKWHVHLAVPPKSEGRSDYLDRVRVWAEIAAKVDLDVAPPDHQRELWSRFRALGSVDHVLQKLEAEMKAAGGSLVFCHNDLQAMNVILTEDDGDRETTPPGKKARRGDGVHFIDFEYSGVHYRGFDLANHLSEYSGLDTDLSLLPSAAHVRAFLGEYAAELSRHHLKAPGVRNLQREVQIGMRMSAYCWTIWGLAEAVISDIAYDYIGYAHRRVQQYFALENNESSDE